MSRQQDGVAEALALCEQARLKLPRDADFRVSTLLDMLLIELAKTQSEGCGQRGVRVGLVRVGVRVGLVRVRVVRVRVVFVGSAVVGVRLVRLVVGRIVVGRIIRVLTDPAPPG